jgi:predicted acetyltransferase
VRAEQWRVIAPQRRKHGEAIYDLTAKVFPDFGYYETVKACREVYFNHSHHDWETSRIGLLGERVVTHFGVWDYQMRIGTSQVRTAGVGAVATDGDLRKRGLMDQTASAALEAMRAAGYELSVLFGIGNYYHRYGYARAWSDFSILVNVNDLPGEKSTAQLRAFRPSLRNAEMIALYNAHHRTTTGAAVRPTYQRTYPWTQAPVGQGWREGGRLAGYVLVTREGRRLKCLECCGETEQALRVLKVVAQRCQCDQVQFETLPHMSDPAKQLRRGNCRIETRYCRNGGAMVRVINLPSALQSIGGELSRRLQSSHLAGWRGELLIADQREQAVLRIGRGQVKVAAPRETPHTLRGGDAVAQLLLGTEEPGEVIEAGRMEASGEAGRLAEVLFPAQWPQLSQMDRY